MKRLLLLGCCIAVCLVSAANRISAQTQFEMNQSAAREFNAADAEMDAQLKQLFKMAEGKPQSLAKLKQAQSAWQAYRDAHIKAYWPSENERVYGSVHPMCVSVAMTVLTKARTAELRDMTRRIEGDVCACHWPD